MPSVPPPLPSPATAGTGLRLCALIAGVLLSIPASLGLMSCVAMIARAQFDLLTLSLSLGLGTSAFLCGWFGLRGGNPRSRLRIGFTITGALIVGGVSFAAGFFGPIIFSPQANQGPLLGIFFTGPIGLAVGAILGWIVGRYRVPHSDPAAGKQFHVTQ